MFINYYFEALKNYANFKGRANRSEFWYYVLCQGIIGGLINVIPHSQSVLGLYLLITALPSISINIRRLHDVGKSGWYFLIPIYGTVLLFFKSDGVNKWSDNTLIDNSANRVAIKTTGKKNLIGIYIGLGIVFIILVISYNYHSSSSTTMSTSSSESATKPTNESNNTQPSENSSNSTTNQSTNSESNVIGIGQTLKTDYFEVTVHKAILTKELKTGNEFTDESAGASNQFLVMTTTFKNIDNESRMLVDGIVYITYNGKEYKFDKSETILLKGYGLLLEEINPLTIKTTKLVYKLPAEIKGPAYYQPGRASEEQRIFLGDLK